MKKLLLIIACVLVLTACGDKDLAPGKTFTRDGVSEESLPTPAGTPGSAVTGMPNAPGPGQAAVPVLQPSPEDTALDEDGNPILPPEDESADPGLEPPLAPAPESSPPPITVDEPTAQDAVAVVRDYYAAINGGAYARAYALWADGGRSSGQSPQQFADGFADTLGVSVQVGAMGPVEGAAGSRFIQVPVSLVAGQREGGERHFEGTYTLRRAAVDGATPEQRTWHIASASLREVQ